MSEDKLNWKYLIANFENILIYLPLENICCGYIAIKRDFSEVSNKYFILLETDISTYESLNAFIACHCMICNIFTIICWFLQKKNIVSCKLFIFNVQQFRNVHQHNFLFELCCFYFSSYIKSIRIRQIKPINCYPLLPTAHKVNFPHLFACTSILLMIYYVMLSPVVFIHLILLVRIKIVYF